MAQTNHEKMKHEKMKHEKMKHENEKKFNIEWTEKCLTYKVNSQPHVMPSVERIIVIGDIHGDLDMCYKSLQVAKLIDGNKKWIGGNTVVVQVGDQIDRCRLNGIPCKTPEATVPDENSDLLILKYFTELHRQALDKGGAVYSLVGNHELMNVKGDMRYVSYQGLTKFDVSEHFDASELLNYKNWHYKIGEESRRHAFSPGNPISDFLACTRQMGLIIGSNLFAHAGVLPSIAKKYSIKNLNQLMSLYLFNKLNNVNEYDDILTSNDSPLWNRVFGNIGKQPYEKSSIDLDDEKTKSNCDKLLKPLEEIYKVTNIIVGHTPLLNNGIGNACGGRIWLTDYGVSKAFDKYDK